MALTTNEGAFCKIHIKNLLSVLPISYTDGFIRNFKFYAKSEITSLDGIIDAIPQNKIKSALDLVERSYAKVEKENQSND